MNKCPTPLGNDFTYVSPEWTHDWLARSAEIIQSTIRMSFFDWWIGQPSVRADLTRFTAFYYNHSLKNADRWA
jgi:alpha-L-fucosidase